MRAAHGSSPDDVNILLIGDAQSGKTSLVKIMKLYAGTGSVTKEEFIVQESNGAVDEIIKATLFRADIHTLEIRAWKNESYRIVDLDQDAKTLSQEEFDEWLSLEEGKVDTCRIRPSEAKEYCFTVYEAPGFHEADDA